MLKSSIKALAILGVLCFSTPVYAQFNLKKVAGSATKTLQAVTLTDQQMAEYVKESVEWMDKNNPVSADDSPYTIRLKKLTENLNDADGIPLNFKVYEVIDVNAFACPDGSVRVFSSLMDIMNDDELLGIIGHEIGHVIETSFKKSVPNTTSIRCNERCHSIYRQQGSRTHRVATRSSRFFTHRREILTETGKRS